MLRGKTVSLISPKTLILEIGYGYGGGPMDYAVRIHRITKMSDEELEEYKTILAHCHNRAIEEQAVRRLKAAQVIPEVESGDKGS
jgi:hypothetical protein